jgi:hypothetical protein
MSQVLRRVGEGCNGVLVPRIGTETRPERDIEIPKEYIPFKGKGKVVPVLN